MKIISMIRGWVHMLFRSKAREVFEVEKLPARGAVKGPGSVEYGFKFLQGKTLVIDPKRTPNAYKEITEYEYDRDKEGNVISGYPDGNDHAISALRYAYEPCFNKRGNSA